LPTAAATSVKVSEFRYDSKISLTLDQTGAGDFDRQTAAILFFLKKLERPLKVDRRPISLLFAVDAGAVSLCPREAAEMHLHHFPK
jgi:hypothetical protein